MASRLNLSPDTLVPISAFGVALAGVVWLFSLHDMVQVHEKDITKIAVETQQFKEIETKHWDSQQETLSDIRSKTAAIDAKLELLLEWSSSTRKKNHAKEN